MATRVSASRLIGRASELAELEAAFDEAASGAASLAFLAGESGVGKSTLMRSIYGNYLPTQGAVRVLHDGLPRDLPSRNASQRVSRVLHHTSGLGLR